MATKTEQLITEITADATKFRRELNDTQQRTQRFADAQRVSINQIRGAFAGLAAGLTVDAFAGMIKGTIDAANHLGDLSTRLGISTEALSQLHYAAEVTGVSTQTLEMGLQRMTRRVAEAANGSGEAVKALEALGISAVELSKLEPDKQFLRIASALDQVEDQGQRVALAMKLFDSEGVALLQTMNGGSDAVQELMERAEELGLTMSGSLSKGATDFNEKLIELKSAASALKIEIAERLLPVALEAAAWLQKIFAPTERQVAVERIQEITEEIHRLQSGWTRFLDNATVRETSLNRLTAERAELIERITRLSDTQATNPPIELPAAGGGAADTKAAEKAAREEQRERERAERLHARQQEQAARQLDLLQSSLLTEEEALDESYARRLEIINDALNREIIDRERHAELVRKVAGNYEKDSARIDEKTQEERLSQTAGFFGDMAALAEEAGGRMVEISRGAALVEATIHGALAVQKALGAAPPPANFALAAAAAGLAAVQVATIAGARAMGGPVAGGSTYLVGERGPELFTPNTAGQITPNSALGGTNVTIVEDSRRAGQVTETPEGIEVAVSAVYQRLSRDISQGTGMARIMEKRYSMQRQF